LGVCAGPSIVSDVVAGIQLIIGIAGCECAVDSGVVGRGVVCTANSVIDMLAHSVSIGISGIACLEAEHIRAHEIMPLNDLGPASIVRSRRSSSVCELLREDQPSKRVSSLICTVGIHLAAIVARLDVDLRLVDEAYNLDVRLGARELNTFESARWDETSASARLGTPSYHLAFDISDD